MITKGKNMTAAIVCIGIVLCLIARDIAKAKEDRDEEGRDEG